MESRTERTQAYLRFAKEDVRFFSKECGPLSPSVDWIEEMRKSQCPAWLKLKGADAWKKGRLPRDAWAQPVTFAVLHEKPHFISFGADGKAGGSGLDADIEVALED